MKINRGLFKKTIMSILLSLGGSFIAYIFTFHNDVIAMKIEFGQKKEVLQKISTRLDNIDSQLIQIYNVLIEKR